MEAWKDPCESPITIAYEHRDLKGGRHQLKSLSGNSYKWVRVSNSEAFPHLHLRVQILPEEIQ